MPDVPRKSPRPSPVRRARSAAASAGATLHLASDARTRAALCGRQDVLVTGMVTRVRCVMCVGRLADQLGQGEAGELAAQLARAGNVLAAKHVVRRRALRTHLDGGDGWPRCGTDPGQQSLVVSDLRLVRCRACVRAARSPAPGLTPRERLALDLRERGASWTAIGAQIGVSATRAAQIAARAAAKLASEPEPGPEPVRAGERGTTGGDRT
jgi:hypothetical protein